MTSPMMAGGGGVPGNEDNLVSGARPPLTTGSYLVVFSDEVHGDEAAMADAVRAVAGVSDLLSTSEFGAEGIDLDRAAAAGGTIFPELGIAVVAADPTQVAGMVGLAAADPRIVAVEPEHVMYAIDDDLSLDYLRGYRDATAHLYDQASAGAGTAGVEAAARFADTAASTWGLQATRVTTSKYTGAGVRVAVLDTGFDLENPDFANRKIVTRSFVPGENVQDGHGHGTHCIGTSCGVAVPPTPPGSRRYGVAPAAEIFVGKVLSNAGSGTDRNILAAISWAISNRCQVISMSLGADVRTVSVAYETVGRRALAAGTLIVAAAGNNGRRREGDAGFVGMPANSPSIMAVAAIDARSAVANFSARSNPVAGGQVDIAGPGVNVYSSWPLPARYNTISGTSMATPHVAGIAALWAEATGLRGAALWSRLQQSASRLPLPSVDVGAGLAQAPQ